MRILLLFLLLIPQLALAKQVLNIYNWADYMPTSVLKRFEQETGIEVNYTEYDSNETMYAKLKSNSRLDYDLIFPSSYYVDRMSKEKRLLPLDHSQLTYYKNLNTQLLNQSFDPNNAYSVPYLWGTTAIVVNRRYYNPNTVKGWEQFWSPALKNQLLLLDDMREVFAIALLRLGYSINDVNPNHVEQAYKQLKLLWPNIKLLSSEAAQNLYIDEDVTIGMGLNGEIFNALTENPNLTYIYPLEGFEIWVDCMAIPANAPHPESALKFINFILRPDNAKEIAVATGFSTPNQAALSLLPTSMSSSQMINPGSDILKRGQFLIDLGNSNALYEKYWNQLKIGG